MDTEGDDDIVNERLLHFAEYFVKDFETVLKWCCDFSDGKITTTVPSNLATRIFSVGKESLSILGSPTGPAAKSVVNVIGNHVFKYIENQKNKKTVTGLFKLMYDYRDKNKKADIRKILVDASVDVFYSFEMAFMMASNDFGGETRAMLKLAADAVQIVLNYYAHEYNEEPLSVKLITEGLSYTNEGYFRKKFNTHRPKHGIILKRNESSDKKNKKVKIFKLYTKSGLIIECDDTLKYYSSKKHKSKKYGYRRLFTPELFNEESILSSLTPEENQFGSYSFNIKFNKLPIISQKVLDHVNKNDEELIEQRLKESNSKQTDTIIKQIQKCEVISGDLLQQNIDSIILKVTNTEKVLNQKLNNLHEIVSQKAIPVKRVWFHMRSPIESFTGRNSELKNLQSALTADNKNRIVVICGLGGVGKSELLRKFAHTHKTLFDSVIWINSSNPQLLKSSIHKLASETNTDVKTNNTERHISAITQDIYNHFHNRKCLFIFDNANNRREINQYLEFKSNMYFVVTSQNIEWGDIKCINLSVLSPEDSSELIKQSLHNAEENEDILKLGKRVQYLPLALQQAIAYIIDKNMYENNDYKIKDYLEEYEVELLFDHQYPHESGNPFPDFSDNDYTHTVFITLKMNIDRIKYEESTSNLALEMLYVIAFLNPDYIKEDLFKDLTTKKSDINSALRVLNKYSLITRETIFTTSYIHVHRLIQTVLQVKCNTDGNRIDVLNNTLNILSSEDIHYDNLHWTFVLNHLNLSMSVFYKFFSDTTESKRVKLFLLMAHMGCYEYLQNLLNDHKESILNVSDDYGDALYYSSEQGHANIVRFLIGEGINMKNCGQLALHIAVFNNNLTIAKLLIDNGIDINTATEHGSHLDFASAKGHMEIIRLLVTSGADINKRDQFNRLPLHYAAEQGYESIVSFFSTKGCDVNSIDESGNSPLVCAASGGHFDVIKLLLTYGSEINHKNNRGQSALHRSASRSDIEIINILIKNGADINIKDQNERTPLHSAAQKGCLDCVELLINNQSNINEKDVDGKYPLHFCSSNGHIETAKLLILNKAEVNAKDNCGETALHYAVRSGHKDITELLISSKGLVNVFDNNFGDSLLHCAASSGHTEILELLLFHGAIVNCTNRFGETPLHYANLETTNFKIETLQLLVTNGAQINVKNSFGKLPLHYAVERGHITATVFLIKNGSSVNDEDEDNKTPLSYAYENNNDLMIKILTACDAVNTENKI